MEYSPSSLAVVGLGYVGLPLAVAAGRAGMDVLGLDLNSSIVDLVNEGRSHIQDVQERKVARLIEERSFEATSDMTRLSECDVVCICVPTPLSKTRDPDVSHIAAAAEAVSASLRSGQLIVLESTTYPGTTREMILPRLEAKNFKVGKDFYLCFSPERVDPGNSRWSIENTPRVIGGITPACTAAGVAFYEKFIDEVVPVSSPEVAEMTKILENTFRAVNIGLANETALIADHLGVDVWEVMEAAATKPFGFMKFTPGPGLGGHCIPIDPQYLSWKMRTLNYNTRFINLAAEINSTMPHFVVGKLNQVLARKGKSIEGARILLLGVTYKRDISDVRESPALDVLKLLIQGGSEVSYHDPYMPELYQEGVRMTSIELTSDSLSEADAVVILTGHSGLNYERVLGHAQALVDMRHAVPRPTGSDEGWIVKG